MLTAAADPAYREMNRVEAELADRLAGATPLERFEQLLEWLTALSRTTEIEPSRAIPKTHVQLL